MKTAETDKKKIPQPAGTRNLILESALELFADRGYEGVSVQDIAAAVGIKAASLYAHFPGKEGIFRDVFALALGRWRETAEKCMALASGPGQASINIARALHAFVTAVADSSAYRFWTRVYVFPPPFLREGDLSSCAVLDREFEAGLKAACAARLGLKASSAVAATLAEALMNYSAGLMMNSTASAPSMKRIEAVVALMMSGAIARSEGRKK